jgi:hypothetical protein
MTLEIIHTDRAYVVTDRNRELAQAQHVNRVRGECLEIAMKALEWCASNTMECIADKALIQIGQRLAQLEEKAE